MARKKSKSPRKSRGLNVLRLGYAAVSTELTMRATTGTGIVGFFTGKADIRPPMAGYTGSATYANPDKVITLGDLMKDPSNSLMEIADNTRKNFIPLVLGSVGLNIGFKLGKRLLAPQRRNVNYLLRETVGKGVAYV